MGKTLFCKSLKAAAIAVILLSALFILPFITGGRTAHASEHGGEDYAYGYSRAAIVMNAGKDGVIGVEETLTVQFTGRRATTCTRYLSVGNGEQVKNVSVAKLADGNLTDAPHEVGVSGRNYISVEIGDDLPKGGETYVYVLKYDYCVKGGNLNLNLFDGKNAEVYLFELKLTLPAEAEGQAEINCGSRRLEAITEGNVVTCAAEADGADISLGVKLPDGTVESHFDITPYYFVIAAVALILIIAVIKFTAFNKSLLSPVVDRKNIYKTDPLIMGKLIDNKVNSEDVAAMAFYWANKGYLRIDIGADGDITLVKLRELPATANDYEHVLFGGLFRGGNEVKIEKLKNVYYRTAERATALVEKHTKGLYLNQSIGLSVLAVLLGGLLLGAAPFALALKNISSTFVYFAPFLSVIPALIVYALTESMMYYRLKLNQITYFLFALGIGAVGAVCCFVYCYFIPSAVMPLLPKALLSVLGFVEVLFSVLLISRNKEYARQLNEVVGFKRYVINTGKPSLVLATEENPAFYYEVIPYAYVLNVLGVWEEKFRDIPVTAPVWLTGYRTDKSAFRAVNAAIKRCAAKIAAAMSSRPADTQNGGRG